MSAHDRIYRCEACKASIKHPDVDECDSVAGMCAFLMGEGWRPVHVHVYPEQSTSERVAGAPPLRFDESALLLARGGWFCPACVKKYERPTPRKRRKSR